MVTFKFRGAKDNRNRRRMDSMCSFLQLMRRHTINPNIVLVTEVHRNVTAVAEKQLARHRDKTHAHSRTYGYANEAFPGNRGLSRKDETQPFMIKSGHFDYETGIRLPVGINVFKA